MLIAVASQATLQWSPTLHLALPQHEAGEVLFNLRTRSRHPGKARKYSVEVKVLHPGNHPWRHRRWVTDDLATQVDTLAACVDARTCNQLGDFMFRLQARRTRCDCSVLGHGRRYLPWLSGSALRRQEPPDKPALPHSCRSGSLSQCQVTPFDTWSWTLRTRPDAQDAPRSGGALAPDVHEPRLRAICRSVDLLVGGIEGDECLLDVREAGVVPPCKRCRAHPDVYLRHGESVRSVAVGSSRIRPLDRR